jgi:BirA family transcriptional regulator, biotin operon repressor / biotin---[acetyl-CoA-carboxylase] ligase
LTTPTQVTDILKLATVDSTNSEALRQWQAGRREALWIISDEQTAGRGRENRNWVSRPGNLYASLLLPLAVPPAAVPQLSLIAAVAMHETIAHFCEGANVTLKWPNDCLVNGAKIAGILIESLSASPQAVCIGMGINVAHAPDAAIYPTTCVVSFAKQPVCSHLPQELSLPRRRESGPSGGEIVESLDSRLRGNDDTVDVGSVFQHLSTNISDWLTTWNNGQNFREIRRAWCERSIALGRSMQVRNGNQTVTGLFIGLGDNGELLLQGPGGHIEHIYAGDVMPAKEHAA